MNVGTIEGILRLKDEFTEVVKRAEVVLKDLSTDLKSVAPAAAAAQAAMKATGGAAATMGKEVKAATNMAATSYREVSLAAQAMVNTVAPSAARAVYAIRQIPPALKGLDPAMKSMLMVGSTLSLGITLPLGLVARATARTAAEFETSMTRIETLVGVAREEVERWKESVRGMVREVGVGPTKLAEGLYYVTGAGIRTSKALEIVKDAAKASAIGLGEMGTISRTVVGALQAWEKQGLDSRSATETLVATVREGNLVATEVAGSFGRVMSIAATMGVTFDEVGAYVATFSRQGVSAAEAVTSLRGVLGLLMKESRGSAKMLEEVGLSAEQLRATIRTKGLQAALTELYDTFDRAGKVDEIGKAVPNIRALAGVLATVGTNGEAYVDVLKRMKAYHGELDKTFQRVTETAAYQWGMLSATINALAERIGSSLLPGVNMLASALTGMVGAVTEVVRWFQQLPGPIGTVAKLAVGVFAAGGPLLVGLAVAIKLVQTLRTAFLSLAATQFASGIVSQIALINTALAGQTIMTGLTGRAWAAQYLKDLVAVLPGATALVKLFGTAWAGLATSAGRSMALALIVQRVIELGTKIAWLIRLIPGVGLAFGALANPVGLTAMAVGGLTIALAKSSGIWDQIVATLGEAKRVLDEKAKAGMLEVTSATDDATISIERYAKGWFYSQLPIQNAIALVKDWARGAIWDVKARLAEWQMNAKLAADEQHRLNEATREAIELARQYPNGPPVPLPGQFREGAAKPKAPAAPVPGMMGPDQWDLLIGDISTSADKAKASMQDYIENYRNLLKEVKAISPEVRAQLKAAFETPNLKMDTISEATGISVDALEILKKQFAETERASDRASKKFQKLNDAFTGTKAIADATQMVQAFVESGLRLSQLPTESLKQFGEAVQEVVDIQRLQQGKADEQWVSLRDAIALTRVEAELFNKTIDPVTGKLTMTAEDMRAYMEMWAQQMVAAVQAFTTAKQALEDSAITKALGPDAVAIADWARRQKQALDDLVAAGHSQGEMWDTVKRAGRESLIAIVTQIDPAVWGLQSMEQVLARIATLLPGIDLSKLGIDKDLIDTINAMITGPPKSAIGAGVLEGYRKVFSEIPDMLASSLREAFANRGNFKDAINAIFASIAAQLNQVTFKKSFEDAFEKLATHLSKVLGKTLGSKLGPALRANMKPVVETVAAIMSTAFSSMMSPAMAAVNAMVLALSSAMASSAKQLGDEIAKMMAGSAAQASAISRQQGLIVGGMFMAGISAALTGYQATAQLQSKTKGMLAGAAAGFMAGLPYAAMTGGWSLAIGAGIGAIAGAFGDATKNAREARQAFVDSMNGWENVNEMAKAGEYFGGKWALSLLHAAKTTDEVARAIRELKLAYEKAKEKVDEFRKSSEVLDKQNGLMYPKMLAAFRTLGTLGKEVQLEFLQKMMDKIASGFNKIAENMLAAFPADLLSPLTDALAGLGGTAEEVVKKFYLITSIGRTGWQEITESVGGTSAAFGDLAQMLTEGIAAGKPFGEIIAEIAKAGKGTLKDLEAALIAAGRSPEAVTNLLAKIGDRLKLIGPLAGAAFGAMLSQGKSVVDALAALEPGLTSIENTLKASGLQAEGFLGEVMSWRGIVSANKDLFTMLSGVDEMLAGLHNTGLLTTETFGSLAGLISESFAQLRAQGVGANEAMRLMQPQLQKLWELSTDFGYVLDDNTKEIMRQAVESGIVGEEFRSATDKMVKALETMVDRLGQIVKLLGGSIPDATKSTQAALDDTFNRPYTIRYGYESVGDVPTGPVYPEYATGTKGFVDFGRETTVRLHGREAVFTPSTLESLLTKVAAQSGSVAASEGIVSGGMGGQPIQIEVPVTLDGYEIARIVATKLPQVLKQRGVM